MGKLFENKCCLYILNVEPGFYKFGITSDCKTRLETHYRDMNFISIIKVFDCNCNQVMLRTERCVKAMAKNLGELVRKYNKTEIIETDDIDKYLAHVEEKIKMLSEEKQNTVTNNNNKLVVNNNAIDIIKIFAKRADKMVKLENNPIIEPKIYTYQRKYTLANGEVRYCKTEKEYIPKNSPGERKRKKKEGSLFEISKNAKELNVANRELVSEYIRELYEKQMVNEKINNRHG